MLCHHAICDGLSLAYIIQDLALFLSNPDLPVISYPIPPAIEEQYFHVKVKPDLITRFMIQRLNHKWIKKKVIYGNEDYTHLYEKYWHQTNIGLTTISLSPETVSVIVKACHTRNVTINSFLVNIFACAQQIRKKSKPSIPWTAIVATNLRNQFISSPGKNCGLLAASIPVKLPNPKGDFWKITRTFHNQFKQTIENPLSVLRYIAPLHNLEPTLLDAIYFEAYGMLKDSTAHFLRQRILPSTTSPKRALDITNIGQIDLQQCDDLETLFLIPILSPVYDKAIGIVTAGGSMNISILFDRSRESTNEIENFKIKIKSCILETIKQDPAFS